MSLLFRPEQRPGASEIRQLVERTRKFSISIQPETQGTDIHWMELLAQGLTFDLAGLAPGPAPPAEVCEHYFGLPPYLGDNAFESVTLTPGPHLTTGGTMVPVVRCLAWLAASMCDLSGLQGVAWGAARSCSSPAYFRDGVIRWIEGGAFPGLGLTALVPQEDGSFLSQGLRLFTGQELYLASSLVEDRASGVKLAVRLLHWLVESGKIEQSTSLTGPSGETIMLEPNVEMGIVRAWRGSR